MQRLTISLDDDLATRFDELIARRGYDNRSEAFRDMVRQLLAADEFRQGSQRECVAVVSYAYNHHARQLSMRLTEHQHEHTDLVISTMHVHVTHSDCAESVVIRGPYARVRAVSESIIAEPGIKHGGINIIPVEEEDAPEADEKGHDHGHDSAHDHAHGHMPRL